MFGGFPGFAPFFWNRQMCTPWQGAPQGWQQGADSEPYMGFPTDKPIENPNTIKINEPTLGEVTMSPEDALELVLSGILVDGYDKEQNLLEQGLDSFGIMQLITRCAEQGYRVRMEEIMSDPTFAGIAANMKTE